MERRTRVISQRTSTVSVAVTSTNISVLVELIDVQLLLTTTTSSTTSHGKYTLTSAQNSRLQIQSLRVVPATINASQETFQVSTQVRPLLG